jgi:RNA polymerase sigma factor (sigma-70 family)
VRHHKRAKRDHRRDQPLVDDTGDLDLVVRGIGVNAGPPSELMHEEALKGLGRALSQLSTQDQEVLSLTAICGLSSAQIAIQLGLDEETVRKRKTRARARLAALWGRDPD